MKKVLFHIYFWVYAILTVVNIVNGLIHPLTGRLDVTISWIQSIVDVVAVVGLFGYLYQKNIFNKSFWKIFIYFYLGWNVLYLIYFVLKPGFWEGIGNQAPLGAKIFITAFTIVFGFLCMTPTVVGLFKYSKQEQ